MSAAPDPGVERIAEEGRRELLARLRRAFQHQAARGPEAVTLEPEELEQLVTGAAQRAGGALWRRSLAEAARAQLGISLAQAAVHPAVQRAHELVGAPPYRSPPAPPDPVGSAGLADAPADALRLAAVHIGGIESLRAGERDIELRFSPAGLDVLTRSSGAAVGHLDWRSMSSVDLPRPRRGLRGRRRAQELHVLTDSGRASFELPGLTEAQLTEHVKPMLARYLAGNTPWPPPAGAGGGHVGPRRSQNVPGQDGNWRAG
jgi:hypothetical protein